MPSPFSHSIFYALAFNAFLPSLSTATSNLATPAQTDNPPVPIFSRAQLKYGLGRTDYYNRWVDRPLYIDPRLRTLENLHPGFIDNSSFRRTQEIALQYGLNGLSFFPENFPGIIETYQHVAKNNVAGFELLSDFGPGDEPEKKIDIAGKILATPGAFKINGKAVITSYLADHHEPEYWTRMMEKIRAVHGDRFLFYPALTRFGGESLLEWIPRFDAGTITPEQEEKIKEDLRRWARATDGLYLESAAALKKKDRTFHPSFYREFVIRLMKEVIDEFKGEKQLILSACIGHENATLLGYTLSGQGTKTLRESLEIALSARPSLVIIPEWDEQNENTSLRPTVYGARSSMRLLRHYTSKERGRLQEPLPGDDAAVPNFVLSARKIIVTGEPLRLELLHIPEQGVNHKGMSVQIELRDQNGKVVYTGEPQQVPQGELWVYEETLPSEQFVANSTLLPVLKVTTDDGGTKIYEDGFLNIDLRSTSNNDYKWAIQPLRDILVPLESSFTISSPEEEKGDSQARKPIQATVKFAAPEPLAFVEVLDTSDVIYSHHIASEPIPRETKDNAVFLIEWQSLEYLNSARKLKGWITLKRAEGKWTTPAQMNVAGQAIKTEGNTLHLDGLLSSIWDERSCLTIPKSELNDAVLSINLEGIWQGEIPLKTVFESGIYGIPGPIGFNLVVSRYMRQDHVPYHLGVNEASFTIPILPDLERSRLQFQAIAVSGKLYRSRPIILGEDQGESVPVTVYSDSEKAPITVEIDRSFVPDISYQFAPKQNGSVLTTTAGRPYWGILGGSVMQSTGKGGGEINDGTPFIRSEDFPGKVTESLGVEQIHTGERVVESRSSEVTSAPEWVEREPGKYALAFNGSSNYITLPQGVIPRRAGFEIVMELKPDHIEGTQLLLSNRGYYPGSLTIVMEGGELKARYLDENGQNHTASSGLKISPGEWSTLRVRYNLRQIIFELNGKSSLARPLPGPGVYDTVTTVGGYGKEWYAGQLGALHINHAGTKSGNIRSGRSPLLIRPF